MPTESVGPEPRWLEPLCRIPVAYRSGNLSIRELFTRAAPDLDDPQFVAIVARRLEHDPSLLSTWQDYSYDKRATPSHYLDGLEVGFIEVVDGRVQNQRKQHYETSSDACAVFILHEARWVLERRHID